MNHQRKNKDFNPHDCGVTHFLSRVGGTWKVLAIYAISIKVNRFSMLQKAMPGISKQSLVNVIRDLEEDNIIRKIIYPEFPKRIEYQLTRYGRTLLPVIRIIEKWGQNDLKRIKNINQN